MRRNVVTLAVALGLGLGFGGPAPALEVAQLARIPDIVVLERGCAPPPVGLNLPNLRGPALAEVAARPPEQRTLTWLVFLEAEAKAGSPFGITLIAPAGEVLDPVRAALVAAGFAGKAQDLQHARRKDVTIGGLRMTDLTLPTSFGTKADLAAAIVGYVHRTPALGACLDAARAALPGSERLGILAAALVDASRDDETLAGLPAPYRVIWLGIRYVGEVRNGGVEQFFSSSTGAQAPETAAALRTLGLPKEAAVVERGIAAFGADFPTDRTERLDATTKPAIGNALDSMTDEVHVAAIEAAMAAYAEREAILPH